MEIKDVIEYKLIEDFKVRNSDFFDRCNSRELKELSKFLKEKDIFLNTLKKERSNPAISDKEYVENGLLKLFRVSIKELGVFGESLLGNYVSRIDIVEEDKDPINGHKRNYHALTTLVSDNIELTNKEIVELQAQKKIVLYGKPESIENNLTKRHLSDLWCSKEARESGIYIFASDYNVCEGEYTPQKINSYDTHYFFKYYPKFLKSIRYGLSEDDIELSIRDISRRYYEALAEKYKIAYEHHLNLSNQNKVCEEKVRGHIKGLI